jgi:asparagine synthase (glutamine-hydrolysing)
VNEALSHFNGMFAFALWDQLERILHLGRDRFGEKPLYYSRTSSGVIFGSELKALRLHPQFEDDLDRGAIALFLRHNCIPCPYTIYSHTAKLPPATLLTLHEDSFNQVTPEPYWSAAEVAQAALETPFAGSKAQAAS